MTEKVAECRLCGRELREGDIAWATDWKVVDVSGTTVSSRWVTRYSCDDCEQGGDD